jgi:hypothetical protein
VFPCAHPPPRGTKRGPRNFQTTPLAAYSHTVVPLAGLRRNHFSTARCPRDLHSPALAAHSHTLPFSIPVRPIFQQQPMCYHNLLTRRPAAHCHWDIHVRSVPSATKHCSRVPVIMPPPAVECPITHPVCAFLNIHRHAFPGQPVRCKAKPVSIPSSVPWSACGDCHRSWGRARKVVIATWVNDHGDNVHHLACEPLSSPNSAFPTPTLRASNAVTDSLTLKVGVPGVRISRSLESPAAP